MAAGSFPQAGFYYQNIIAAQYILELIDLGSKIQSIELEKFDKAPHIDDIIITYKDGSTKYYQIKWSGDETKSYTLHNLFVSDDDSDKSLIEQLATGYTKLESKQNVEILLYTTRPAGTKKQPQQGFDHSLGDFLRDVHNPYIKGDIVGKFDDLPQFVNYQKTIEQLFKASKLDQESEFCIFLHKLRFHLNQSSMENQRNKLTEKLDNLGIERSLYGTLLNSVVEWSLPPQQIITAYNALQKLGLSERFVDRLAHDFKIKENQYVENSRLFQQLDEAIDQLDNGFVFLEGSPGSGKSTALTIYRQARDTISFVYYCYIPDEEYIGNARMEKENFLRSLCIGIQNAFPEKDFPKKYSQDYENKLNLWLHELSHSSTKVVIIIDGLDHVHRKKEAGELEGPLTNALSGNLPHNILFIVSAQYIEALPSNVRNQIQSSELRHIKIAKFTQSEVSLYLRKRGFQVSQKLVTTVTEKSAGIPLYLYYIANILQNSSSNEYEYNLALRDLPFLQNDNINSYHTYLYQNISKDELNTSALAILANRKEYTDIDALIEISNLMGQKISRYQAEQLLNRIKHLLNISDAKSYAIYHDSFREFILSRTQLLHDDINEALICFYQAHPQADETYRHYFRHLFELEKYQTILQECNRKWLETSWQEFRPFPEINANIDLAWQSSIKLVSFREFIRIAFLKYQFYLIQYYVTETTAFKAQQFLLEIGMLEKAIRMTWDGTTLQVPQKELAEFITQYYKLTKKRIPDRIAMIGLDQPHRPISIEDLKTFSCARALYPDWLDHFNWITEIRWSEKDRAHNFKSVEMSSEQNLKTNTSIQLTMLEGVFTAQEYDSLIQIAKNPDYEQIVKHYALFYAVQLLLEAEHVHDAISLLDGLEFSSLENNIYNHFILLFAKHNELTKLMPFINIYFLPPPLFDELLEENPEYKIKDEVFYLYDCLRIHFLQNANGYHVYLLKASSLKIPASSLFTAIIELAKLWDDTTTNKVDQVYKVSKCKQILNHLNVDRQNIDISNKNPLDQHFISKDIHRIYILLFDYVIEYVECHLIIDIVQHWLSLDTGENGYKSNYTNIEFAKRLSTLAVSELRPFVAKLLQRAEKLSREDEETSVLVDELLECAKAYGYCGFAPEANHLWQEVYRIACGINDRKDYQFNAAINALQRTHKISQDKSLSRLAKLLHLTHQLIGASQARIPAIAIQSLIAFACNINFELALELLHQEDAYISRESGIREVVTAAFEIPIIDLRYLWAIIKTMDKWDDFNTYNDITYPTLLDLFETTLNRGELDLASGIYNFCKHQFLIEKDRPGSVYDLAELCQKHGISISSSLQDLIQFKTAKDEAIKRDTQQNPSLPSKEFQRPNLLDYNELHLASEQNFDFFERKVENVYHNKVYKNRKKNLKQNYYILKQLFDDWYEQQSSNVKQQADSYSIAILRTYGQFMQKICELPTKMQQREYDQYILVFFDEFRSNIQNMTWGINLVEYIDTKLDIQDWLDQISKGDVLLFETRQEIAELVYKLIENSSLENLKNWGQFCHKWIKHDQLTKALLQIARRIKKLDKKRSQELLIEAWNANSDFFFEYQESTKEFFNIYFDVDPDQAKKSLLQSFYHEHCRYPGSIIRQLDILSEFAEQFEDERIYDYLFTQYEQHNELLVLGLSEKPTNYNWIAEYKPEYSTEDATICYLVRLFDYPEVEIRKLAIASLFDLILHNGNVLKKALSFCEVASSNCKEHVLSLAYTVAITRPEIILPLKSSLIQWLTYPHFNIKQTVKEILLYCANQLSVPFEQWEIDKILITNIRPNIFLPSLAEGELLKGKKFILSSYQSTIMYKLYDYQHDNDIANKLYTRLVSLGWTTKVGMEQESEVHKSHNINTNFDTIEINGPYYQVVQESINILLDKEIKKQVYDNDFIEDIKHDFRLYDPSDMLIEIGSRPNIIGRTSATLTDEQFSNFEDLTNVSDCWKLCDDEWIILYEDGHQRVGEPYSSDSKHACYFSFISFLASSDWGNEHLKLFISQNPPFVLLENIYRHELRDVLPNGNLYPIRGIRPIIGISKRAFRGQNELSIATLLPDFADALQLAPSTILDYKYNDDTVVKFIQWQEKYDQGRRRQKPLSAGVRLQIKRKALQSYLEKGQWNLYYLSYSKRSIDKYASEEDMEWETSEKIGELTLSNNKFSWIS